VGIMQDAMMQVRIARDTNPPRDPPSCLASILVDRASFRVGWIYDPL
jgi:hypothetical protein